jgi:hypothetical protein
MQSFLTLFSCRFLVDKVLKAGIIVSGIDTGFGYRSPSKSIIWVQTGTILGRILGL